MGAESWDYLVPLRGDIRETLAALRHQVFRETHRAGDTRATLEELEADEAFMGAWGTGTGTIIDIYRVVDTFQAPVWQTGQDYNTLRPLAPDRIQRHFGTSRPTVQQYRDARAGERWESLRAKHTMRSTRLYVILYTDGEPTHAGIWGRSGD
jgi:hypothetical protein